MESDLIIEIGIDNEKRLYVKPESKSFPYIYREAMEVHWNDKELYLYGAKPRQWEYKDWYVQILSAAKVQNCVLKLAENCVWSGISNELKEKILENEKNT